jgi:hypothetical protein
MQSGTCANIFNKYAAQYSLGQLGFAWIFIGSMVQALMFALIFLRVDRKDN